MYTRTNENVFLNVNNLIIMSQSITTFIEEVAKKPKRTRILTGSFRSC
jgi:hypothetical protein